MQSLRNFFEAIRKSLINPRYYNEIKTQSFWKNLSYLYVLLLFISLGYILTFIIPLIQLVPETPKLAQTVKTELQNAYPDNLTISVNGGQLSTNAPQPYFYKNFVVIDTNASADDYPKYKDRAQILVTKSAIVYPKDTSNSTEIFFLSEIQQPFTLDKSTYLDGIGKLEPYLAYLQPLLIAGIILMIVVGPFFGASFMLSGKLFTLLIFSFIFYIGLKIIKKTLTYSEVYKMAMHASTLPILFYGILGLFHLQPSVPFGYSLLLALIMGVILNRLWTKNS